MTSGEEKFNYPESVDIYSDEVISTLGNDA